MLNPKLADVFTRYFGDGKMVQADIARELCITQQAVSYRIRLIRQAYLKVGVQLPTPGATLRTVKAQTLSGVWCRNSHEYMPTQN